MSEKTKKSWKIEIITLILLAILGVLSYYFSQNPEKAEIIQLSTYQAKITSLEKGLWVTFIICIIGNLLPLPTPYVLITWIVAQEYISRNIVIPLLVAIIASFGSLIGEMAGYIIGRGANEILAEEHLQKAQELFKIIERNPKLAPFLIYLFGATPLNDDLITVPLGMIKYPMKKTVFWCWLGKLTLMIVFAYLPDIWNVLESDYSFITTMIPLFAVVILMYLILKIDWIQLLERFPKLAKILHIDEQIEIPN